MDALATDPLARSERHLRLIIRGAAQATLERWRAACPELAEAPITSPSDLRAWLRTEPTAKAGRILAGLVGEAQHGDEAALMAVIVCLGPGIRTLAIRSGVTLDEAVSELVVGILRFPVARRSSIAGGLLLDARNRLYRAARRAGTTEPIDDSAHPAAPGELGTQIPAAQRIVQLVCQAHRQGLLDRTEARLILDTRLRGHRVRPLAEQLGLTAAAAYQRRSRAEARLTQVA